MIFWLLSLLLVWPAFAKPERNFSCDLATAERIPSLVMVGENHYNELSKETRNFLFNQAKTGKIPLGSEVAIGLTSYGAFLPPSKYEVTGNLDTNSEAPIHGIESEIPFALINSYQSAIQQVEGSGDTKRLATIAAISGSDLSLNASALGSLAKTEGQSPEVRKLAQALNSRIHHPKFKELSDGQRWSSVTEILEMDGIDEKVLGEFVMNHHKELINIANQKYLDHFDNKPFSPITNSVDRILFGCDGKLRCRSIASRGSRLLVEYRDRDMAHNIIDLLCHYKGSHSHLYVIVGADHLPGINKLISEISNDRTTITEFRSYDKDAANEIVNWVQGTTPMKPVQAIPRPNPKPQTLQ